MRNCTRSTTSGLDRAVRENKARVVVAIHGGTDSGLSMKDKREHEHNPKGSRNPFVR